MYYVKALKKASANDISGKSVNWNIGDVKLVADADLLYFKDHPDVFTVLPEVNGMPATLDGNSKLKTRIISSFGGLKNQSTQFSNATTQLSATDRIRVIPWADANNIQAVMINGSSISNGKISAPGNAVMVAVSIENGASPYPQFSFKNNSGVKANTDAGGGRTAHYIGDGEVAISEPLAYPLLTVNTNYIHSYHKVATLQ